MFYVISYDIPDDKRRLRLAKTLLDYGTRVQYSVFECLLEPMDLSELEEKIKTIIRLEEDRVRIYNMCAACQKGIVLLGEGRITEDPDVYIV